MNPRPAVMIVEDDDDLRELYDLILSSKGFRVTVAEHGGKALELLDAVRPDVILLDLFMPIMNGQQFLEEAKLQTRYPRIRVILFSNVSDAGIMEGLYGLGISQHVLKSSLLPDDLVALVEAATREAKGTD